MYHHNPFPHHQFFGVVHLLPSPFFKVGKGGTDLVVMTLSQLCPGPGQQMGGWPLAGKVPGLLVVQVATDPIWLCKMASIR